MRRTDLVPRILIVVFVEAVDLIEDLTPNHLRAGIRQPFEGR
jgi:hypothetical protein